VSYITFWIDCHFLDACPRRRKTHNISHFQPEHRPRARAGTNLQTVYSGFFPASDKNLWKAVLFQRRSRVPHICLILADVAKLESHICKRRADVGRLLPPFNLKSPNLKS
jgi:hypothetical protein